MTAPYDDGGGEPLAAPPSAHTPPGFGPPGQTPTYHGSPLAAPKPPRQKLFVGLMAFFGLLAVVAVVGFFVTAGDEHGTSAVLRDRTTVLPLPTDGVVLSPGPRPTGAGRTLGPVPKPVTYRGTGSRTIRIRKPEAGVAILDVEGRAPGNGLFAVYAIASNGARIPVVTAFTASYKGSRLLDETSFTTTTALEVEASGPWTVTVRSARAAREMGRTASGSGDTVFLYTGKAGIATIRGGAANSPFVVKTHEKGFPRLVLTHLGAFDGSKPWPAGPVLVDVQAKGRWTVTVR
jgi:hypothetical protein